MKKWICALLALALCGCLFAAAAGEADDRTVITGYAEILKKLGKGYSQQVPDVLRGKAVFAIYEEPTLETSAITTEYPYYAVFWDIPEEVLADSTGSADWALLVYPAYNEDPEDPIEMWAFAVDLKKGAFYAPFAVRDRSVTLEADGVTVDLEEVLQGNAETYYLDAWKEIYGEDDAYRQGLKFMEQERYYSAFRAFCDSWDERATPLAQQCEQPWPRTGELWREPSMRGGNMELTFRIDQDSDEGFLVKLYKSGQHVSTAFVYGSGSITLTLPGGKYVIKDGSGSVWYGLKETFGDLGSYETMTFDDRGTQEVTLQPGHGYTISVNVSSAGGESVGSEGMDWDSFTD